MTGTPGDDALQRKATLADAVVNRRRGGELRVVLSPATVGATTGFFGVLDLAPGEFVSEHYHPYSEEFLFVTAGEVVVRLDGQPVCVGTDEGILIPIGARHRVQNDTDGSVRAVFHLAPLAPEPQLGHVDTEDLPNPEFLQLDLSAKR